MWRKFDVPASEDVIRKAANEALPEVLEATGKKKTQLSKELFNCPSALGRFLNGKEFSHNRLRRLVEGFDDALAAQPASGCEEGSLAASG
ncbi:hypothetical protein [Ruegeria sp. EL01]|jgi:hypothetical protein|uniref:hypothetical protein n=1 Tax=Ruegeria sp. EL01 TaxID=2107578 RepID=UPI000EA832E8|nr:hypothetical protein [Ruegeria sp. EL01]